MISKPVTPIQQQLLDSGTAGRPAKNVFSRERTLAKPVIVLVSLNGCYAAPISGFSRLWLSLLSIR